MDAGLSALRLILRPGERQDPQSADRS